jgi:hypothetical protein
MVAMAHLSRNIPYENRIAPKDGQRIPQMGDLCHRLDVARRYELRRITLPRTPVNSVVCSEGIKGKDDVPIMAEVISTDG